jgi:hypothetical protein
MKLIFESNEQEKKEILEQHNFFKKALQSKVTRLMVNEQSEPLKGVEFLNAARNKKCKIAVGGVIKSAPGKPSVLFKVADYDSTNGYFKRGDELYIKDNYTFDVVTTDATGKKTLSASNKKWACPAMNADDAAATEALNRLSDSVLKEKKENEGWMEYSELKEKGYSQLEADQGKYATEQFKLKNGKVITLYKPKTGAVMGAQQSGMTDEQREFIKKYKLKNGKLKLTPEEQATQLYRQIEVPGSREVTGWENTGLRMWFNLEDIKNISGSAAELKTTIENQQIELGECKKFVDQFFRGYEQDTDIPDFDLVKRTVQRCKSLYSPNPRTGRKNRWGWLTSQKDKIDILSGLVSGKGPSKAGNDAKWRLN